MTAATLAPPATPTAKTRSMALILLAIGIPTFMVTLDNLVVSTALPVIRVDLNASLQSLQWFVNAYTLPFAAFLLTAAAIGDRIGRRRMFLTGLVVFTLASAAAGLATTSWELTAARAIQGLGGAAVMPLALTLLAQAVPENRRTAAVGIWGGISGLGVAVGPVVGGAVVTGLDWHWIFFLNVPVGVIAVVLVATVLDESRGAAKRLDPLGLLLSSAGTLLIIWGVVDGPSRGWTSTRILSMLIGGGVLVLGFVGWQWRNRYPMLPLTLFRSRGFSLVNVVQLTFSAGTFGAVFLLSQFFQVVQQTTPLESGLRTLPWTAAPMIVAPLAGIFGDRIGGRNLIVAGQVLLAGAILWMGLSIRPDAPYTHLIGAFLMAGVGMGLTFSPVSTMALASVSADERGVASGTSNTIRELGVAAGVAALASIFTTFGSFASHQSFVDGLRPAVLVGAAIVAVGAVVALFLPGRSISAR
jgi:EmrB/QacA subfamily drug resistance transporter